MNCEEIFEAFQCGDTGDMTEAEIRSHMEHIASCDHCRNALRGMDALKLLKPRGRAPAPELFDEVLANIGQNEQQKEAGRPGFWTGAGVGGLAAAALFGLVIASGWIDLDSVDSPNIAEFSVALYEPRHMDLAFETDKALAGATISILMSGDVAIDGYGKQRELTWTENLDAGLNRLRLPVIANGAAGGQMIVRLNHPLSERVFVINIRAQTG